MLEVLNHLVESGVDAELWALGSWMQDADRRRARRYVEEHGLEPRVLFPGYVERQEVFEYLSAADIGMALLDTEHYTHGVPTKVFEYLYAGLPVVITPIDAVGPYLPEDYTSVVPQGDTEAAATAVKEAMERPRDRAAMRSLVEEKYSWESEAEKLDELYRDLLS
jgi:glycosyltransferase involved in cell wall biosynthesis